MGLPRIRFAFGYFGDLRLASLAIFIFLLVVSGYFMNKYFGMYIHSRVLHRKTGNLSQTLIDDRIKNYVTVSEKGSFFIGSTATLYFITSIYGFVAITANEVYILITPIILLPFAAFVMLVLIFFDLGIQENAGFFFFWIVSGFVIKIAIAVASIYSFIVVFSYYMEVTEGPLDVEPTSPPSPKFFPRLSSGEPKTIPKTSLKKYPTETKLTPSRPPSPKTPLKSFSPKSPPRIKSPKQNT